MSTPVIAFFNSKGGVGTTSLVYHLAWMYADLGLRVIAVDLDPQTHLTETFLNEERLGELWQGDSRPQTIYGSITPLLWGLNNIAPPHLEYIEDTQPSLFPSSLALLVGDLSLSLIENDLSLLWSACLEQDEGALRITSAFWQVIQNAIELHKADIVLLDLGPSLGAINRAAFIAADYLVTPLSPDSFSLELRNLGLAVQRWKGEWQQCLAKQHELQQDTPSLILDLPGGEVQPIGYTLLQYVVRLDQPLKAHHQWNSQIPPEYRVSILAEDIANSPMPRVTTDPYCLALLKPYRSLIPLAQEAHKPVFRLKPADGAVGSHMQLVHSAYKDFRQLAENIAQRTNIALPSIGK